MTQLFSSLFAVALVGVASVTSLAFAQAPAAATDGTKTIQAKIAMCIGCHAIPGYQSSFPEVHRVPMIAGQSGKYIVSALTAYKAGERKHPTMRGIGEGLSEQDMIDIGAYYEKQAKPAVAEKPSREPSPQVAALLAKGACVSCHGANLSKPVDPSYPKIGGQYPDYLFVALKAYKAEPNNVVGRTNGVMGGIAKQFTNAELRALAQYVGSLQGEMQVQPQSRFR